MTVVKSESLLGKQNKNYTVWTLIPALCICQWELATVMLWEAPCFVHIYALKIYMCAVTKNLLKVKSYSKDFYLCFFWSSAITIVFCEVWNHKNIFTYIQSYKIKGQQSIKVFYNVLCKNRYRVKCAVLSVVVTWCPVSRNYCYYLTCYMLEFEITHFNCNCQFLL